MFVATHQRREAKSGHFCRVCAALMGLVFLSFPWPLGIVKKILIDGIPFPCQNCSCGCRTAEQCWTNCCCYTPAERLAWAKARGISPPQFAEPAEGQISAGKSVNSNQRPGKTCCCCATTEAAQPTGNSSENQLCETKKVALNEQPERALEIVVTLWESERCAGKQQRYLMSGLYMGPVPDFALRHFPLIGQLDLLITPFDSALRRKPDFPPPRSYLD